MCVCVKICIYIYIHIFIYIYIYIHDYTRLIWVIWLCPGAAFQRFCCTDHRAEPLGEHTEAFPIFCESDLMTGIDDRCHFYKQLYPRSSMVLVYLLTKLGHGVSM